jgi:hypothetical protein
MLSSDNPYPTDEEIAQRVHEMFLDRECSRTPIECWTIAETELLERAAARVIKPVRPKRRRR